MLIFQHGFFSRFDFFNSDVLKRRKYNVIRSDLSELKTSEKLYLLLFSNVVIPKDSVESMEEWYL